MSRFLAIDIDPAGLFVAAGTIRGNKAVVERTLVWEDAQLPLTPASARGLGERLKEALKAADIAPAPLLVGVGREKVILKELRYPPVPEVEEPNIVRFQAMKELTESPDEVVLDYVRQDTIHDERRAMAFVIRKELFAAIQTFSAAAGLKLIGVTPRPFAVAAALKRAFSTGGATAPERPADAVAVIHLGPQGGEFTVVRGDQVTFTRTISAPAVDTPQTLTPELKRNLTVYAGQNPQHPVQALYVAEAAAPGQGWAGRLRLVLPVPVLAFDPLSDAGTAVPADAVGRFVGAVGLLAAKAGPELPINFVTPRQPKVAADPNRRLYVLAALACSLVLGLGAVYGFLELTKAERRYATIVSEKASVDDALSQLDPDAKRLQAVDDWSKREVVWLDEMYDLFDRFPNIDQARINTLTGTAILPDKTGKQPAQAKLELKLGTKNADEVAALVTAFDRENTEKNKFYLNPTKTPNGIASNSPGGFNQLFNFGTMVNRRAPQDFIRQSQASPPPRGKTDSKNTGSAPAGKSGGVLNDPWFNQ